VRTLDEQLAGFANRNLFPGFWIHQTHLAVKNRLADGAAFAL
jgi:hypothetical protein